MCDNEVAGFEPIRVSFFEYDPKGELTFYTGLAVSEFTDPEDFRPSYHVRLDDNVAEYPNQHKDPYVDECRQLDDD